MILHGIRVDDWVFGVSSVAADGSESPVASAVPGGAFGPYVPPPPRRRSSRPADGQNDRRKAACPAASRCSTSSPSPTSRRASARSRKAFGLKGNEKIALKQLLRDMGDEGLIDAGPGRAFHQMGGVPKVTVLRVVDVDDSGRGLGGAGALGGGRARRRGFG